MATAPYADILVDVSLEKLDHPFTYKIPEALQGILVPGMCVEIPFGKGNKPRKGYVLALRQQAELPDFKLKCISGLSGDVLDDAGRQLALAAFLQRTYGGTLSNALRVVLPVRKSTARVVYKTIVRTRDSADLWEAWQYFSNKKQQAKARLCQALVGREKIPYAWVRTKLHVSASTIAALEAAGFLRVDESRSYRNPVKLQTRSVTEKTLTAEQQVAVDAILADLKAQMPKTYLLYGITGSGKTQVYLEVIKAVVESGRQAICLIPEIALTFQTLQRFYDVFGDRVSFLHSGLTAAERFDQHRRAREGEIDVIIGPRSALFTPFPNIGIIVMDEEHETSYKSEQTPKYHAREVAKEVARLHGAGLLLGSATPSLETYHEAMAGKVRLLTLTKRATGSMLPLTEVVDLREELREGNRSMFSTRLQMLLKERLEKKEQAMLFLNRRGYLSFLSCRSCGKVLKCPHCDVSLSLHKNGNVLCHYCGYSKAASRICPGCGSKQIGGFKAGTQQVEEALQALFPGIRTLRMDSDTTKKKDSYEAILSAFGEGKADVLIGTQMIVKGHDFPNVTLVGVLLADISLGGSDFHAAERTFQLLTQAIGRAGRDAKLGTALIQTYQPDHYAIRHALQQDYAGFYEEEIAYRRLFSYPPLGHLLAVQVFSPIEKRAFDISKTLAEALKAFGEKEDLPLQILGPCAALVGKVQDIYRYVLYVKAKEYEDLITAKDVLEEEKKNLTLPEESVQFDFDPTHTL